MNKKNNSQANDTLKDLVEAHGKNINDSLIKRFNNKFPSQTQDKFTVRFPDGMRDKIAEIASQNGRSMNSEIINMLKDTIDDIELLESLEESAFSEESTSDVSKKNASKKINHVEQSNIIQPEMTYTFTSSELMNLINTEVDKIKAVFFVAAQRYNTKGKK